MAYAIFYNHQDCTAIAANVQATMANSYDDYLTVQEKNTTKQTFQRAWVGGLNGWATAPLAPPEYSDGDPDCRIVVVTGAQVSRATLIDSLNILAAKVPGAAYMGAIARDIWGNNGDSSASVEPWPPT